MFTTPEEYLQSLDSPGQAWLGEFLTYMSDRHRQLAPIMFRQRPMYKIGKSYVLFSVAKEHFTVHTLNFDLIEALRTALPGADYGKGCVKVRFEHAGAKPALRDLIDRVVQINSQPDAPEVDRAPELPRKEALAKALPGVRAQWLPLYGRFLERARAELPEFTEYFPAVNVLWKHTSTFAQISATAGAMRVEFYSDALHPERLPVKTAALSKKRVSHTVEFTDDSGIHAVLPWIAESYELTRKKE